MRVIIFGASGMIGSGVLIECLEDSSVTEVLSVARRASGVSHPKLRELVHSDFMDFSALRQSFAELDACFFCLGISSVGLSESQYTTITHDYAVAAAREMVAASPQMTFVFVSGAGADSTESGRIMWARVKGKAENAILALPFRRAFIVRPAVIQPMKGVKSRTTLYRVLYTATAPITPLLRRLLPRYVTTTVHVGRAMLALATVGYERRVLESADINQVAGRAS